MTWGHGGEGWPGTQPRRARTYGGGRFCSRMEIMVRTYAWPMSATFTIRPCEDGDWPDVLRLLTDVYVGEGYVGRERAAAFYQRELLEGAGTVLTAVEGRGGPGVLGVVILLHRGSPLTQVAREDEAEFRLLAVDARGRGRGIGEALVAACIAGASRAPLAARRLVLWTRPRMTAAQRLYERLGFRRAPERDGLLAPLPAGSPAVERWVYERVL